MNPRNIKQVRGPAFRQGIGAQHNHLFPRNGAVELVFVFEEILPVVCADPISIAAEAQSGKTLGQCHANFFSPSAGEALKVKFPAPEVPVSAAHQLDLSRFQAPINIRNGTAQGLRRALEIDGIVEGPNAVFVGVEARREIGGICLKQVKFRIVKQANVRSSGHLVQNGDPGGAQLLAPVGVRIVAPNPMGMRGLHLVHHLSEGDTCCSCQ